jgi:hypothetical protein
VNISSFSCSNSSGALRLLEKQIILSLPFIDLYVPTPPPRFTAVSPLCSLQEEDVRISLSRQYSFRPRTEQVEFQVPRGHHTYIDCTILGQGRNTEAPLPLFPMK